jgi:hypothetical protein
MSAPHGANPRPSPVAHPRVSHGAAVALTRQRCHPWTVLLHSTSVLYSRFPRCVLPTGYGGGCGEPKPRLHTLSHPSPLVTLPKLGLGLTSWIQRLNPKPLPRNFIRTMKDPVYRTASPYSDPNVPNPKSKVLTSRPDSRKSKPPRLDYLDPQPWLFSTNTLSSAQSHCQQDRAAPWWCPVCVSPLASPSLIWDKPY